MQRPLFRLVLVLSLALVFGCNKLTPPETKSAGPAARGLVGNLYGNQGTEPSRLRATFHDAITPDGRIGLLMNLFDAQNNPADDSDDSPVAATIEARPMPIGNVRTLQNNLPVPPYLTTVNGTSVAVKDMNGNPLRLGSSLINSGLNIQMAISGNPASQKTGIPAPCRLAGSLSFNGECYRMMLFAPLKPPADYDGTSTRVVHQVPLELDVVPSTLPASVSPFRKSLARKSPATSLR
jgi:hypothetical protein